ncbi:glutamate--cysteine ligase [Verminephrobacter eiseniae]|uniref:glutamate--cysteine ligase n=1 Tax=Verminephrobacter eiseniae TaxID=364317 RepID=UPI002242E3F4|nr:glutamate--cysteine ligase [Verminephrobacter eiseniae]MCW8181504.1 glutamate--cysteine ligase [Verminephrobacter eiseniae]
MSTLQDRLAAYPADALRGMRCGIEKEGLRALPSGGLALTPHPLALGSALTHPLITTDYSESQLELITGAHRGVQQCLDELTEVHQFVHHTLKDSGELLWASSMPCGLPTDETIPLARYGSSNIGRAKSVYRMGLGHRYGRRMQTISGIHYNWSLPGVDSGQYFALIRNFRRHAFVLLYLFGASPALCPCFVQGREHRLQQMAGGNALYLPHATSLRMGRLGYQSEAQARLAVSYNGLQGYADSLHEALTQPYPAYESVGLRNPGGDYNQLGTSLLQIENEFYGSIRPKRSVRTGERPLHALRERGVEYVEVRLMDLDPFVPVGITAATMRLLDVFLLHCLLSDSPPDTPEEIAELQHNQQLAAERGREPGLRLQRNGHSLPLTDWGAELLAACAPLAAALDASHGSDDYGAALHAARALMTAPASTPSARVLDASERRHGCNFEDFARRQSIAARDLLLALPWSAGQQARYLALADESVAAQKAIEAADTLPFEAWREQYMAVAGLG